MRYDYCNRFLDAIRPQLRLVELDYGWSVPIVQHSLTHATKTQILLPNAQEPQSGSRVSINPESSVGLYTL